VTDLKGLKGVNLADHRDNWQALVNTVKNFWFSENLGNFLMAGEN